VTTAAIAPGRPRRQGRPGRGVLVIRDLANLQGPAEGMIELPQRLFWSADDSRFSLDDPAALRSVYQKVLREAALSSELVAYLNGDLLIRIWPDLFLPEDVRRAWEHVHPVLAAARTAAAV
jgi:hypothetical protein